MLAAGFECAPLPPGRLGLAEHTPVASWIADGLHPRPTPRRSLHRIGDGVSVGGGADHRPRAGGDNGQHGGSDVSSKRLVSGCGADQYVGEVVAVLWFAGRGLLLRSNTQCGNMLDACRFDPECCQFPFRRLLYRRREIP
jgi:hypothetical protein